ncbi:NAD+ synthase [Sulfitobacter pseudonitzschiae]|uniref:Glutamine-dependent NAD(+) synthetase n=1 Tax=Pseudosulfitobacter pseudonitzschiae TaxID=1402135 RepID=A0A9Q2NKB9_9RHOB|nr:NAD+ synthase [Pseudosulfitobacter pseudonitzschiae]MBM2293647.1 NAD+ synthase [Pseudosulfitobacter pseudonitzschiae]MBM2298461.1 NAD+ synthase [Pseudosulfitobacter pseudonitzschiae]MBM2303375.1 NAD+ synthase [Pseudosulfitobacter pseudonitzschiae]MBM2313158.1 NAD+ synthase [Pseudosulfitobacter pseudonitzschiae]MBM2318071.1 NAD+ synthase [Pseudosulfitobacter pseudonitzschiae]
MADTFRITLGQLNPTVGDIDGNAAKARAAWEAGRDAKADMVALPELFITGYNAQDLMMKPAFHTAAIEAVKALAVDCADGPTLAIGCPWVEGTELFNAYLICRGGRIVSRVLKHHLPNETVFDEVRVFDAGPLGGPYSVGNARVGSPICEDAWHEDVAETLQETGAEFLLVPNGSPYYRDKMETRLNQMVARVVETGLPLIYLNMVGGQDDQVFDGASFALNPGGKLAMRMPVMSEAITHVDLERTPDGWRVVEGDIAPQPDAWEQDYHVMVLALRDYMAKTGFKKVLLGMSGGVDSALVATIAADAIGPENVRCVMLPSEYTSPESLEDAEACAKALGCHYDYVPIAEGRAAITNTLAPLFEGMEPGLTEENIQSRLRGLLLMAMSNKFGEMLLTTGNKSEVAVGYATIYGDMAGGYNPIKDLYKTRVFTTCEWRNANHRDWMMGNAGTVIPQRIITKPPSAELRDDQKDSDSLPDYPELDAILDILVDQDGSIADCVAAGFARETAQKVERLLFLSEYKRFQSAPGARLTKHAFWLDRRYPIVNRWRDQS